MKWDEFKKEWQKLEKSRKTEVIQIYLVLCYVGAVCRKTTGQFKKCLERLEDGRE